MSNGKIAKNNNLVGKKQGRPKGALNKTTMAAKEAIAHAFEGLGGADRLTEWAKLDEKNESAFWTTIYPKLLPLQVNADAKVDTTVRIIE